MRWDRGIRWAHEDLRVTRATPKDRFGIYIEPSPKIYYLISRPVASAACPPRVLNGQDGFPWCDIDPAAFASVGVSFKEIDRQEVNNILSKGVTDFYPYLDSLQAYRFKVLQSMGIYIDDESVGFTHGGLFYREELAWFGQDTEAQKLCGEIGLIHVAPRLRGYGIGSLLRTVAALRLLDGDPEILVSHVYDKTGKIKHLISEQGLEPKGIKPPRPEPEYQREFANELERLELKQQLTDKVIPRLGVVGQNRARIRASIS